MNFAKLQNAQKFGNSQMMLSSISELEISMTSHDSFDASLISVFRSTKGSYCVEILLLNALMMIPVKLKLAKLGLRIVITPPIAEQFAVLGEKDWTRWQHAERLAYYPSTKTRYIAEGPGVDVYGPTVFLDLGVGLSAADAYLTKIRRSDVLKKAAETDWKTMNIASRELSQN